MINSIAHLIKKIFFSNRHSRILNKTLEISFDPHSSWGAAIGDKLQRKYINISISESKEYVSEIYEVKSFAIKLFDEQSKLFLSEKESDKWRSDMKSQHPWITKKNIVKLYSQTIYYLHK